MAFFGGGAGRLLIRLGFLGCGGGRTFHCALHPHEKVLQCILDGCGVLAKFAEVDLNPGHDGEELKNRKGGLGKRNLGEYVWNLTEQATAWQSVGGRHS